MTTVALIIGFRDRGRDPRRRANLDYILDYWRGYGHPILVVDDGRTGDAQFNRHAAYNRGAELTDAHILCYVESDMIVPWRQMDAAITAAADAPGLVVPYSARHELSDHDSHLVRAGEARPAECVAEVVQLKPRRIGAVNVISRTTLNLVGRWDEQFEGTWWDDRSMHHAFDVCAGPTRWIDGPAWHLYHLPGWRGDHLTPDDRAATLANQQRWRRYKHASTPDQIRHLTAGN